MATGREVREGGAAATTREPGDRPASVTLPERGARLWSGGQSAAVTRESTVAEGARGPTENSAHQATAMRPGLSARLRDINRRWGQAMIRPKLISFLTFPFLSLPALAQSEQLPETVIYANQYPLESSRVGASGTGP